MSKKKPTRVTNITLNQYHYHFDQYTYEYTMVKIVWLKKKKKNSFFQLHWTRPNVPHFLPRDTLPKTLRTSRSVRVSNEEVFLSFFFFFSHGNFNPRAHRSHKQIFKNRANTAALPVIPCRYHNTHTHTRARATDTPLSRRNNLHDNLLR